MKFYGWKNTKTNRLLGTTSGGEWARVSFTRYLLLTLFGFITATDPSRDPEGREL